MQKAGDSSDDDRDRAGGTPKTTLQAASSAELAEERERNANFRTHVPDGIQIFAVQQA